MQVRKNLALQPQARVAEAAVPDMVLILKIDGYRYLNLVFHAEALLVHDLVRDAGRSMRIHGRRDHRFVFRIGFFRGNRARQIQFAARPDSLSAELPQISNHLVHLFRSEGVSEGRHDLREAAKRSAIADDGFPVRIHLGRGLVHWVKSGNVRGLSKPATVVGVPLPSEPWQATHPAW